MKIIGIVIILSAISINVFSQGANFSSSDQVRISNKTFHINCNKIDKLPLSYIMSNIVNNQTDEIKAYVVLPPPRKPKCDAAKGVLSVLGGFVGGAAIGFVISIIADSPDDVMTYSLLGGGIGAVNGYYFWKRGCK